MQRWTLADIPWSEFEPSRIDRAVLKVVKAAALVERNGDDYATYLCSVFADDPDFCILARAWAKEEIQHGEALARWAQLADPEFDFGAASRRFTEGYRVSLDATESIRGSRAGEFVARCIVEVGTSSFYSALRDSIDEPVLREICRRIAADEVRHYKLFRRQLQRYLEQEGVGFWRRLSIAIGRLLETEDDELAYAYYAANGGGEPYDRARNMQAYIGNTLPRYRLSHVERGMSMIFKAVGLAHKGWIFRIASRAAHWFLQKRGREAQAAA